MSTLLLWFVALLTLPAEAASLVAVPPRAGAELSWELTVAGRHVGYRGVEVRWDGADRVFEGWTTLNGRRLKGADRRLRYEQRVTANAHAGRPASFHAALEQSGRTAKEVQARRTGTTWTVTVAEGDEARTHRLPHTRVDLSSIDLLDPEAERSLRGRDYARVLIAETGKIEEGPVEELGRVVLPIGDEVITADLVQWTTSEGSYRFWYATNGWLVRWEAPLFGLPVEATLLGDAPRSADEFPVATAAPEIEVIDL